MTPAGEPGGTVSCATAKLALTDDPPTTNGPARPRSAFACSTPVPAVSTKARTKYVPAGTGRYQGCCGAPASAADDARGKKVEALVDASTTKPLPVDVWEPG